MRRTLRRFLWPNLTLNQKSIVVALSLLLVNILLAIFGLSNVQQIEQGLLTVINSTSELANYSQSIQSEVTNLERIINSINAIVTTNASDEFTQVTVSLPQQYDNTFTTLNEDLEALRLRSIEVLTDDPAENPYLDQIDAIEITLSLLGPQYESFLNNARYLANPATGFLNETVRVGQSLENITTAQASSPEQIAQVLQIRSIEAYMLRGAGASQVPPLHNSVNTFVRLHQVDPFPLNHPEQVTDLITQYLLVTEEVGLAIDRFNNAYGIFQVTLSVLREDVARLDTASQAITNSTSELITERNTTLQRLAASAFFGSIVMNAFAVFLLARGINQRLRPVFNQVSSLEGGNLDYVTGLEGLDEFATMSAGLDVISEQMRQLTTNLSERVAQSTRDLTFSAELGRLVGQTASLQDLMNSLVESIRERFDFYHAQVFLVDDSGENANLVASTGTVGRQLLGRGHFLPVGSQSVVGQATGTGTPSIALDTGSAIAFRKNELLPKTRSEMALPLKIGDRVIGALDIQSVVPNAFDQDDVAIFEVIAGQLAMIVHNNQLEQSLNDVYAEFKALESRILSEGWRAYIRGRTSDTPTGYVLDEAVIQPHNSDDLPDAMRSAIEQGDLIIMDDEDEFTLGIPIKIQDEVVGVFGFGGENIRNLSSEDLDLVRSVTERIGMALESIRLADEAALRAEQEERINEISSRIALSTNVDYILQTATEEIGRILRSPQTSIQLKTEKGRDND